MAINIKEIVLRDTPFADLMKKRVYNVLLIATKYDAFMLEDDGRVDEQLFKEYSNLSLRYPPRFTQVTTRDEALSALQERDFQLVIVMPNMDDTDIFATAKEIKARYAEIPIVVLTPFSREVTKRVAQEDLSSIDYIFSWLGNADLLLAIIKLIEDLMNAPADTESVGVQIILLVEDSVRFYSSALPHIYQFVLQQSQLFAEEALNEQLKNMRMRGRPKVMLARNYEEATRIYDQYNEHILGVVTDFSFMEGGKKNPQAGYKLAEYIKHDNPHVPIIMNSSDAENEEFAAQLKCTFIHKRSKSYPQDLRRTIMRHFGFGPFRILNPATGEEIMQIVDLKDLQKKLPLIPDDSLSYHMEHNHFARFFYSRALFPPAYVLRNTNFDQLENISEGRAIIAELISAYRKMKNEGVVATYQRDRFDQYSTFARIGNGSLGGKGRGLAFMATMVKRYPRLESENFAVDIPRTVVLCTDIFDEYMEQGDLYPIALSDAKDKDILAAFEAAELPARLYEDLQTMLDTVGGPLAVRSSSILEDSHYQPFAGIYATYMIPDVADRDEKFRLLSSAIKAVYASVFYRDSKNYLTATQNLIDQEKMAIVIQQVVGSTHETTASDGTVHHYFYPTLSGVGRSLNFYPIAPERAEEGITNIAFGLGKYIVDGGQTLRFSPRHPDRIIQLSSTQMALKQTQKTFLAIDLDNMATTFDVDDGFNLAELEIRQAEKHGTLRYAASTYSLRDASILPSYFPGEGRPIITFNGLLRSQAFPVSKTISRLLEIGAAEMGRPVEIEFALDIVGGKAHFYLLQIRPIVDSKETVDEDLSTIDPKCTIVSANNVLGNGIVNDVHDVLYVKSANFDSAESEIIAREVSELNEHMLHAGRQYVLVGPGRWGSSDPWLGIPIKWSDIAASRAIVECGRPDYQIDPSQGTHFFQNLTSFGVGYFTVRPFAGDGTFDEEYLDTLPAEEETAHLRLVHCDKPFVIKMDGRNGLGVVLKPEELQTEELNSEE